MISSGIDFLFWPLDFFPHTSVFILQFQVYGHMFLQASIVILHVLYYSVRAAIIGIQPQTGYLKQQVFMSSQFWRLEVQDQSNSRVDFF